jgi:c(7)-type cytochrome triheme protein
MTGAPAFRHPAQGGDHVSIHRALIAVAVAVACAVAVSATASAQPKIPPDFKIEPAAKDSPGPVTFSHEKHKEKVEKCSGCHTKVFKMKKGTTGQMTMAKMKAGEMCGACHNGKTEIGGKVAFAVDDKAKCENCHKK